jgi:heterodisulfide reductase subunit C
MVTETQANTFIEEICAIPGGEGIRLCIQCGTCTASCPNADKMEYTPSEGNKADRPDARLRVPGSA